MTAGAPQHKLLFAQQLRGIAAILIVITHYFGVYYGAQQVVAGITFSPELHLQPAAWVPYMDLPYLKGPFGVALFFLISGFVIPFSLQQLSAAPFLLARALRIYPTYLCCLAIGVLSMIASAHYWQQPFALEPQRVLLNSLLLHNLAGYTSLDTVNWTLAIEIKFYLAAALCRRTLLTHRPAHLALLAAVPLGLSAALPTLLALPALAPWSALLGGLCSDLNYLLFMLIGTLFYQHWRGLIGTLRLAGSALLLQAAFVYAWWLGPQHEQTAILAPFYLYALLAFACCYGLRARFVALPALDFLADISYPLYAVHAVSGYALLKLLMHKGLSFGPAVTVAIALALLLAWLLHRSVETASARLGRALAARWPAALPVQGKASGA